MLQKHLNVLFMPLFGCSDKVLIVNIKCLQHRKPRIVNQLVSPNLRGLVIGLGRSENLLAMLVGTSKQEGVTAFLTMPTGQHIGRNFGVSMSNMWSVIDVKDRCRYKKRFTAWAHTGHVYKLNGARLRR